ncbi:MAG: DNA-directed DNA polymerase II large subunit [Methanocalculus sp. MSAO_Arc1]|uniref:DNA-directed DNA polymerase II large subunit n=1 Tax=Methanocalculus TaxID=71151 RepID=UPI000FEDCE7C|nr:MULTISPECIES: DNA-directed DNA polymerase II large subunit [unclassified Methanocalculus]MCP1662900.1 DNA polymerase II large subunit [Methanocalculus sp. AMF5]RQD80048.1 MAG: DNA-directed DNA polymerase II large subunit [Methanocalculus sp. MSAO_Arc1]
MSLPAMSPAMEGYLASINAQLEEALSIARQARLLGFDPETVPEIPIANDLADRVEALLDLPGVAARIRELEAEMSREEAALRIGDDFVARKFGETTREEVVDHAIRCSMALLTEGVVSAPTEGIAKVGFGKNDDGSEYLRIYYAGPIRSAGGTAQALSVLVGDYVRQALGINRYIPRNEEIERYIEEIRQYNNILSLQYAPSDQELRLIIGNCPVCIDGEPTEKEEVSGYRNLDRVETNAVRGGMALVIAEGLALKAPKVQKNVKKMKIEGWDWLDGLVQGDSSAGDEEEHGILPKDKYLKDAIAGRPVFAYPMRKGGFRLRLGRARNSGFAAAGLNPATMHILGEYLAPGTQMKVERPGKAAGVVPVDSVEGPTVRLDTGEVLRIDDLDNAIRLGSSIEMILDVGEILIGYGEFLENNHPLVPPSYCEEWWLQEGGVRHPENEMEAISFAMHGAPLHPDYTWYFEDLSLRDFCRLADLICSEGRMEEGVLLIRHGQEIKALLEEILIPHRVQGDDIVVSSCYALLACLGLSFDLAKRPGWESLKESGSGLDAACHLSGFRIRSKAGTRIGARMGRPGKSAPRKMKTAPHALFPIGDDGGARRSFQGAGAKRRQETVENGDILMAIETEGQIRVEAGERRCRSCGDLVFWNRCGCGSHTDPVFRCVACGKEMEEARCPRCGTQSSCSREFEVNIRKEYDDALATLGMKPGDLKLLKGVKGLISRERAVEPIEKGALRAVRDLFVFKDGTVRYDMIDLPLTHFRADEIGVSPDMLQSLGYLQDIHGEPLTGGEQVCELKPQDILVSRDCGEYLVRVAGFVDDLLEKLYGLPRFYRAEKPEDLVGQLLVGLAPHTSAGVLARLIGFSEALVGYAHPFFHAAKRRNCFDGDTVIGVYGDKGWRDMPIREFVLENFDISQPGTDRLGTFYSDPASPHMVVAIDTNGTPKMRTITSVSVHRSPDHLIIFETERGKKLAVTPDHAMLVWDCAYLKKIRAVEVKPGDCVPVLEGGMVISDRIRSAEPAPCLEDRVYCLTVAEDHTLHANGIFCGQCDGDEDCVMLLLDGFINFSRSFLPETRGGTMDAPLVLTSRIDPKEVDKETLNLDVMGRYPLSVYEACLTYTPPKDLEGVVDYVEKRLGTPAQYEGFSFTHDTSNISAGPQTTMYTRLGSMVDKLNAELDLAKMIRAVDEDDLAERVLTTHFIRDMIGNLNAFSKQGFRCPRCGQKFRRMPLAGKCRCGNKIIATVTEGSVKKYLAASLLICDQFRVSDYTKQRIAVIDASINSTFGEEEKLQLGLADFM